MLALVMLPPFGNTLVKQRYYNYSTTFIMSELGLLTSQLPSAKVYRRKERRAVNMPHFKAEDVKFKVLPS